MEPIKVVHACALFFHVPRPRSRPSIDPLSCVPDLAAVSSILSRLGTYSQTFFPVTHNGSVQSPVACAVALSNTRVTMRWGGIWVVKRRGNMLSHTTYDGLCQ